jgi:hypothetical protein
VASRRHPAGREFRRRTERPGSEAQTASVERHAAVGCRGSRLSLIGIPVGLAAGSSSASFRRRRCRAREDRRHLHPADADDGCHTWSFR